MKIGFFMVPQLTAGAGAGKFFIEVAKNLRDRYDVETNIITLDKAFFEIFGKFIRFYYGRSGMDYQKKPGRIGETKSSLKFLLGRVKWIEVSLGDLKSELKKYDVIYAKNELVELMLLKIIGYKNLPPVIVGVHTPLEYPFVKKFQEWLHNFLYLGFVYRWLLNGSGLVHLSNQYTADLVDKNFSVKTAFIYYPFSVEDFVNKVQPKNKIKKFIFGRDKIHLGYTGRLTEQKGIDSLVNIVNNLSQKNDVKDKLEIHIFGSSGLDVLVEDLAQKHKFVKFHGYVMHDLIPTVLTNLDFYITAAKWETFPYNVLEAQAMGLPVIAFDIPGTNEIVIDGDTGYLVDSDDEFETKIIDLVNNPNVFDRKYISNKIKERFNSDKIYQELFDMFTRQVRETQ